jgi:hypothetical protein
LQLRPWRQVGLRALVVLPCLGQKHYGATFFFVVAAAAVVVVVVGRLQTMAVADKHGLAVQTGWPS